MGEYGRGGYKDRYMKQEYELQQFQEYQEEEKQQQSFGAGLAGQDAQLQGDKWRQAFLRVAAAAGVRAQQGADPNTDAVLQAVQGLKQSGQQLQALQRQEAALQVQVAELTLQNMELRRELSSGWCAAEPPALQVRQVVLDPAIQQAFTRMRRELEEQCQMIAQLKEQNASLTFTAESKMGRALINKTKLLAEENQEMAMQLRDGPAALQGALLAVERHHANELRRGISEIKEHCTFLEEENEELSMLHFLDERRIQDLQAPAALAAAPTADRDRGERDRGDRPDRGDRDITDRDGRSYHGSAGKSRGGHVAGGLGRGYSSSRGGPGGRGDGFGRRGRGRSDGGGRFSGHKRTR